MIGYFFLNLATTVCPCDYDTGYSEPEECAENQDAGVEECSIVVCLTKVTSFIKTDCDAADPDSGQISAFELGTGDVGVTFFSKSGTLTPNTEETFDVEANTKSVNETVTGQGRTGNQEVCWMRAHCGKQLAHFILDNCDKVRVYGLGGKYRLTTFSETPGANIGDFKGINFTFSNTQGDPFCFVNYEEMGFATGSDFMASLLV